MTYSDEAAKEALFSALDRLGPKKRVLALPPDGTRGRSRAGLILGFLHEYYGSALVDVMPALGTHEAMSPAEIDSMFPGIPRSLFRAHDWRRDLVTLGRVSAEKVRELSEGKLDYDWPAQVNRLVAEGGHDLIVSIGQVVPHEVVGMANHAKNVFVGTGGAEGIHRSHFLGAVYGMERIMGRVDSPVRALLDSASREFAAAMPIFYALTVVGPREPLSGIGRVAVVADPARESALESTADDALRGIFFGTDRKCFEDAAELSLSLNVNFVDRPIEKAVVYLDAREFKSTWLGNKSIYRMRMAMADGGELVVLGPGVSRFGEDAAIDRLVRKHGYRGTQATLEAVAHDRTLADNLSAAAHLIHGSTEGRFKVTYCPGGLSKEETESAGFGYGNLAAALDRYGPAKLKPGKNVLADGDEVFYVPNPAAGLWSTKARFESA